MRSVYLGNAERGKLGRREFWRIHKQIMCRKGLSSGVIEHYCKEKEGYKFLGIFMGHTAGGKESLIIQKKQNIIFGVSRGVPTASRLSLGVLIIPYFIKRKMAFDVAF